MSLRALAESDLVTTLEDNVGGFGYPITLTDPLGVESTGLFGQSGDISQVIDPDTGQVISGRLAHVVLRMSSVLDIYTKLPVAIQRLSEKPWLVTFDDLSGTPATFRVVESNPDRTLGLLLLLLEVWISE